MSSNELLTKLYEARQSYVNAKNTKKIEECDKHITKLKAKIHADLRTKEPDDPTDLALVNEKFLGEETQIDDIASLKARKNELEAEIEKINLKLANLGGSDYANDPALLGGHVVDGKFVEDDGDPEDNLSVYISRRQTAIKSGHYNADQSFVSVKNPKQNTTF